MELVGDIDVIVAGGDQRPHVRHQHSELIDVGCGCRIQFCKDSSQFRELVAGACGRAQVGPLVEVLIGLPEVVHNGACAVLYVETLVHGDEDQHQQCR